MLRGRARRRLNSVFVFALAVLLVATAGPSLAMDDLTVHVIVGVGLVVAAAGHLWLNRNRAVSWPPSGRLARRPRTRLGWVLKGQDAFREWLFAATAVSGAVLMAGGPGQHLHAPVGFILVGLAIVHAWLHRDWFRASNGHQRHPDPSPPAGGSR